MGIGKRQLLEDYYMDEIGEIIYEYNKLHSTEPEKPKAVDGDSFFGF